MRSSTAPAQRGHSWIVSITGGLPLIIVLVTAKSRTRHRAQWGGRVWLQNRIDKAARQIAIPTSHWIASPSTSSTAAMTTLKMTRGGDGVVTGT
jgi:hypothetical protein